MKNIYFKTLLAFSLSSTLSATCYIRDYSDDHLSKHTKQEIRHISFSIDSWGLKKVEGLDPEVSYYPFQLAVELEREGQYLKAHNTGFCEDAFFMGAYDETTCHIFDGETKKGSFKVHPRENPKGEYGKNFWLLLDFTDDSPFKTNNSEIKLSSYDFKSAVVDTQSRELADEASFSRGCPQAFLATDESLLRIWNEAALSLVRLSLARPTVTARNLYHLSALHWDIESSFKENKKAHLITIEHDLRNHPKNIDNVISYASYYLLQERYKSEPGNNTFSDDEDLIKKGDIDFVLDRILTLLDLDHDKYPKAKALGKKFAESLLEKTKNDGSRESTNYDHDPSYQLINQTPLSHINLPGLKSPAKITISEYGYQEFDWTKGAIDFAEEFNINYWVPLYIPGSSDQNGNDQDFSQSPLTLHWGKLPTFGDLKEHYDADKKVYFNPEKELPLFETDQEDFILQNLAVARASLQHNPISNGTYEDYEGRKLLIADNNPGAEKIDISPLSLGNSELGTNNGSGYGKTYTDPKTNQTYQYEPYLVRAADFYRSIAEFWADGPASETPPGHWNTIANYAIDKMSSFKWQGIGEELTKREYELRLYLALNGALHDAAIVAWGIKGAFQGGRPITVIRKLADMAEKDPSFAEKLVNMSNGLLKMGDANYKLEILYGYQGSFNQGESCDLDHIKRKTQNSKWDLTSKLILDEADRGTELTFEVEEDTVFEAITCVVKFSKKNKLWIQSWLGHDVYGESPDNSIRLRPIQEDEESLKRDIYRKLGVSGTGWMLAENWTTYQKPSFVTPPFPGFVSGHSTFSRAAAEILAGATGSKFFPGGLGEYPAPRLEFEHGEQERFNFQWATYYDAADQSGLSRIYGGIHASYDDLPARIIGSKVGIKALKKANQVFQNK